MSLFSINIDTSLLFKTNVFIFSEAIISLNDFQYYNNSLF